jgi:hypothetical protein
MVFAFAPLAALLLGVTDIIVPWQTLILSVVLYVVIPLAAGYVTRKLLDRGGNHEEINAFTARLKPFSVMGLLATVVLLFGFQAQTIIDKPLVIVLVAVPLIIQSYGIFAIAYGWVAGSLCYGSSSSLDWHLQLFRTRCSCRHRPLWTSLGSRARHRRRSACRGPRHALFSSHCQPHSRSIFQLSSQATLAVMKIEVSYQKAEPGNWNSPDKANKERNEASDYNQGIKNR